MRVIAETSKGTRAVWDNVPPRKVGEVLFEIARMAGSSFRMTTLPKVSGIKGAARLRCGDGELVLWTEVEEGDL